MSLGLLIVLIIGTIMMTGVTVYCRRWNHFPLWKAVVIPGILTVCGVIGVKLLYFIENGRWNGLSFYGAVFFVPVLFLLVAKVVRLPYGQLLDVCAPAECIMLVIMKLDCRASGCCNGRIMRYDETGQTIRFPSQITEMFVALVIMFVLLFLMKNEKNRNCIYPWYMVIYGVTRFILNLFRETEAFIWILPAGNFWSLISIAIGIVWLCFAGKKLHKQSEGLV